MNALRNFKKLEYNFKKERTLNLSVIQDFYIFQSKGHLFLHTIHMLNFPEALGKKTVLCAILHFFCCRLTEEREARELIVPHWALVRAEEHRPHRGGVPVREGDHPEDGQPLQLRPLESPPEQPPGGP